MRLRRAKCIGRRATKTLRDAAPLDSPRLAGANLECGELHARGRIIGGGGFFNRCANRLDLADEITRRPPAACDERPRNRPPPPPTAPLEGPLDGAASRNNWPSVQRRRRQFASHVSAAGAANRRVLIISRAI